MKETLAAVGENQEYYITHSLRARGATANCRKFKRHARRRQIAPSPRTLENLLFQGYVFQRLSK